MISSLSPTIEPKRCRAKVVDHEKFQAIQLIRVGLNSTYHEFSFLFYKMVSPLHHNHCGDLHLHFLDSLSFTLFIILIWCITITELITFNHTAIPYRASTG